MCRKNDEKLTTHGLHIDYKFIPIIYAAETILLYIVYNCLINPLEVVSEVCTRDLHFLLAKRKLANLHNDGKLKQVNPKKITLIQNLYNIVEKLTIEYDKNRGNREVLGWLLAEGFQNEELGFSMEQLQNYLIDVNSKFMVAQAVNRKYLNIGNNKVDISDLLKLKETIDSSIK